MTERLVAWIGWRDAALVYVVLHLAICLPLHWFWLPAAKAPAIGSAPAAGAPTLPELIRLRQFWLLAGSYMLNAVVFSVISVHLVPLFQSRGLTARDAAWIAACAGPLQVFVRLIEVRFGHLWTGSQTGTVALAVGIARTHQLCCLAAARPA